MNRRFTAAGLAKHFALLAATADVKLEAVAAAVGANTHEHIRAVFGDQQRLQVLQPDTISQKEQAGYAQPEAPLIATGELRESVRVEVVPVPGIGVRANIGTEDEKMFWHEFGTARVPARPVFAIGSAEATAENVAIVEEGAKAITTGELPHFRIRPRTE